MKEIDSKEQPLLNSENVNTTPAQPKTPCIHGIAMVFIGLINNIFFLIIFSSAQRIVEQFNANGYLGLVNWSCTFCGLFANAINSLLTTYNVSYDARFIANTICMAIGLLGSAFAPSFWLACASILFIGFSCNFGESVTLGYLVYLNKQHYVKFWGMGTGTAGVLGSLYSALCIGFSISYKLSFLCLIPLIVVYFCSYFFVIRQKEVKDNEPLLNSEPILANRETPAQGNVKEVKKESNIKMWCNCSFIRKIMYYILTIDIVYFAQYVIASAFLDCAQTAEIQKKMKYLFPLLSLTQHIGVLIFCSSLHFFHFPHLILIAVGQVTNFFIWLSQAMLHWMPIWAEFIFIFLVGCCGGLNYVNTYDMEMNDERLNSKEKELGSNMITFSVTISVLISSAFTLLSEKTYLKDFVPKD